MNGKLIASVAGCVALIPSFAHADKTQKRNDQRPNILFILADDMGKECLGCYGSTYKTPVLDKMAEEGLQFNYCSSQPLSTPSRVELLTGKYNYKNYSKFGFMNQDQKTFANLAKEAGYQTCIAGKWQLGTNKKLPAHFGFDNYCLYHLEYKGNKYAKPLFMVDGIMHDNCTEDDYGPDYFSDYICNFMEKNKNKPFLAYYAMTLVHDPFQPTPDSDDWDVDPKLRFNVQDKFFADMCAYTDKMVGKVLKKLDDLKIADNTIVIFVGDNGTARYIYTPMKDGSKVQGGKATTLETGTAVPMIARWGKYSKNLKKHTTTCVVDFTDMLPTFAEAMQIEVPKEWDTDGHSYLSVIKGEKANNEREWAFVHYKANHVPQAGLERYANRYIKTRQYKLYAEGGFYDFVNDPEELRPIAPKSMTQEQRKIFQKLKAELGKFPKWKFGDKNVDMVVLPGLEPAAVGIGRDYPGNQNNEQAKKQQRKSNN